jgi:hypothetical protein
MSVAMGAASRAPVRVDCSYEAYVARDANFAESLCECESEYCCVLHREDFLGGGAL